MHPGHNAATAPDDAAYVMAATGQVVTNAELDEGSNRLANLWFAAGLRPGDHVAFALENHPRFLQVAWAAQRSGLYYTAISSRLGAEEMAYILNDCGARSFIASAYLGEQAAATVADTPGVETRLMLDGVVPGFEPYEDAVASQPSTPLADEREGTDMLYSSGTTGRPKGIKWPLALSPMGTPPALLGLAQQLFGFDADTVYLSPAPLYHAAPLRFCMIVTRMGGTAVIMERFDPEQYLALVERHHVTHSQLVPTMFNRMLKLPAEVRERYDVSSLQAAVHAAAPCPVEVKQAMLDWWGPIIHEYYAGTEGNGFVYCSPQDWLAHPGSVGQAISGVVHICGEDGTEVPIGESGTIYFSGGGSFEYHNDPDKTDDSRHPAEKGWSTLGDVGRLDADGFLYLTDRKAFMIISGGVNIYPQEVENLLSVHPEVADVAVIGVPDDDLGEAVKAVVQPLDPSVLEHPAAASELSTRLIAHCRERLSSIKCPRSVDLRAELPRHPTGKLYKRLLKDEYWAAAGRSI